MVHNILHFQTDTDMCDPNHCEHGATCFNMRDDFYCHCTEEFEGKTCSHKKDYCRNRLCLGKGKSIQLLQHILNKETILEIRDHL